MPDVGDMSVKVNREKVKLGAIAKRRPVKSFKLGSFDKDMLIQKHFQQQKKRPERDSGLLVSLFAFKGLSTNRLISIAQWKQYPIDLQ